MSRITIQRCTQVFLVPVTSEADGQFGRGGLFVSGLTVLEEDCFN
ncbi:hypothetical protein LINPERHAP1_LOCUS13183 [Linum perenne]